MMRHFPSWRRIGPSGRLNAMSAKPAQSARNRRRRRRSHAERSGEARTPLCFVIDARRAASGHFLSLILHGAGIDTEEFADGHALATALAKRTPDLVFLNIALESAEAIECVVALGAAAIAATCSS